MDQDQTLNSLQFGRWRIVAAESGMTLKEIEAVSQVRHRLLAAVWLCREAIPGASPSDVLRVFEAIDRQKVEVDVEWFEDRV